MSRKRNGSRRRKNTPVATTRQKWVWRPAILTFAILFPLVLFGRPLLQNEPLGSHDLAFAFLFATAMTAYQVYRARTVEG